MKMRMIFYCICCIGLILSCRDQESYLVDRYLNLEEPAYYGDTIRMQKILKIHKKLYKKKPNNLIYFSNVFQMNCLLGKYKDNVNLIEEKGFESATGLNPIIYKNFYLALNMYREDNKSNYEKYLKILNDQDLDHNPLLGYIAARCTNQEERAEYYYVSMINQVKYMNERNLIIRMIESNKCERFLELYRGICPICEVCKRKYVM